jgi:hypothetical protein
MSSSPAIMRSSVDLPQPEGPTKTMNSPSLEAAAGFARATPAERAALAAWCEAAGRLAGRLRAVHGAARRAHQGPALVGLARTAAPASRRAGGRRAASSTPARSASGVRAVVLRHPVRGAQGLCQRARRIAHGRPADLRRPPQRRLLVTARPVLAGRRLPAHRGGRRAARRPGPAASAGATRCTAGTAWPPRATPGGRARAARARPGRCVPHRPLPRLCRLLGDPGQQPTAQVGRWCRGRAQALFDAISPRWGRCPSSPKTWASSRRDVRALRDGCGFPGMKILQFAFGGDGTTSSCRTTTAALVVYTGTHDNDTVRGWWDNASPARARLCRRLPGLRRRTTCTGR